MARFIFAALALMLMLEGLMPLIAPTVWRQVFQRMTSWADGQLRFAGLMSLLAGVILFILVK